jgi:SAM-dependent methyltransferase
MDRRTHWEEVYASKGDAELSWFQEQPEAGLKLIDALRPAPASVLDVGGGQSALAAALVARGVPRVTVVDISAGAIERCKKRLGETAAGVQFMVADVLDAADLGVHHLWHDRAVFHFLTHPHERAQYVAAAARAVPAGGHAIVSTFAPDGPERCSGLPVCRYAAADLAREFAPAFALVESAEESHITPWGKPQKFVYAVLKRVI